MYQALYWRFAGFLDINPAPNERNIVYLVSYLKIKCISDPKFFILLFCDYSTFHTYQSRDYATFLRLVMSPQTGRGSNAKSAKIPIPYNFINMIKKKIL